MNRREGFEEIADGKQLDDKWKSHLEDLTEQAPLSFKLLSESLLPVPVGSSEDAIISLIAFDALQLLAKGELLHLHRCANPDCVLLFMDTTGRRKWCSMKICGNRTKVARHQIRREEN
ncbi:CGNR zinc finger domain-containing protein [Salipaludibacillus neizhouensis]|uniref:CGNR zinc finger domain-containing protein n=2 Tax=Salipaludibacillus neizhouensis TaxID=885475 RepID=UPI001CBA64EF|nr:CGNR zinc finger domain-containing protein [Salipaludibacillus neizhouensis]